jgi:hypothetical protein
MRINARLDSEHSKKLEQLKKSHNLSVSDVVKQAIDLMHTQQNSEPKIKLEALLTSDFIGCGQGPENLSENYKSYLEQFLKEKYDSHG